MRVLCALLALPCWGLSWLLRVLGRWIAIGFRWPADQFEALGDWFDDQAKKRPETRRTHQ